MRTVHSKQKRALGTDRVLMQMIQISPKQRACMKFKQAILRIFLLQAEKISCRKELFEMFEILAHLLTKAPFSLFISFILCHTSKVCMKLFWQLGGCLMHV